MTKVIFAQAALLPDGWADDVRITLGLTGASDYINSGVIP